MNVLVFLVPLALGLGVTGLFAFVWSLGAGQYDDLDGAAVRVLSDDDLMRDPADRFAMPARSSPVKSWCRTGFDERAEYEVSALSAEFRMGTRR